MGRIWIFPVFIAALLASGVALLGATITDTGPWYQALIKPDWAPPDAAYGVGWTAIYAFTALAGVTCWLSLSSSRDREWLLGLYALNCFLNVLWSLIFFRLHRPDWAAIEVIALWLSVAMLMVFMARRSRGSAALLLPYLLWVTLAGYLNWTIVQLNGPFA